MNGARDSDHKVKVECAKSLAFIITNLHSFAKMTIDEFKKEPNLAILNPVRERLPMDKLILEMQQDPLSAISPTPSSPASKSRHSKVYTKTVESIPRRKTETLGKEVTQLDMEEE